MAHDPCASFRENIPAYALGALDADEAAALEAHLRCCDSGCQDELAAYRAVGTALLTAVPRHTPPAALCSRSSNSVPAIRGSEPLIVSERVSG